MIKRTLVFLLVVLCIISFQACSDLKSSTVNTKFYYLRTSAEYNSYEGIILAEKRIVPQPTSDEEWMQLINLYLKGPAKDDLYSIFPNGTTLERFEISENGITVILSNEISALEGYDLTLACACLTRTIMESMSVSAVEIRAVGGRMGDYNSITMTKENILLLDDYSEVITN